MADAQTLKQLVLGRKEAQDLSDTEHDLPPDLMTVNMGPSHPAMHGTVRIVLTVDGEHDANGAVHRGMRRAHVDRHQIRRQVVLGIREILGLLAAEDELLERLRVGHGYLSPGCAPATLIGLIGRSSRRTSG